MKLCYFNDITSFSTINNTDIIEALQNTLTEYRNLKKDFNELIDGIVTSDSLNTITLNNQLTLAQSIPLLPSKADREYAYSLFIKYPIEKYFDVEAALNNEHEYYFCFDETRIDGLYLKILYDAKGIAFSLGVHSDLQKNFLKILSENTTYELENLYGMQKNTEFLKEQLQNIQFEEKSNFDKLLSLFTNSKVSTKFENTFKKSPLVLQEQIIEGFATIIEYRKKSHLIDETLLKDVTPEKEKKYTVKELKIRNPQAKRIYFYESQDTIYLASIENKPLKDNSTTQQSTHINNALSTIKELLK